MRILLAQINPTIGDFSGNSQKIRDGIKYAKDSGVQIVLFPEMALVGYPPEDFLLLPHFIADAGKALDEIVEASKDVVVIVGTIRSNPNPAEKGLCNTAAIIENGVLLGFQDKVLLPTYDVFDERRFFSPGSSLKLWTLFGKKVAVTICEDIWQHSNMLKYANYSSDPVEVYRKLKPDFVLNLSASPFSINKSLERIEVAQRAASTLSCPVLLCNQVGGNDNLIFDGRSLYIGADGSLLDCAKGFKEDYLFVDLETKVQKKKVEFNENEDLYESLVLGIRDYFFKSGFKKACLGLSGGIDSAVVACLAAEALGRDNILGLLLPSRYSSAGSLTDAEQLAHALDVKTHQISIEGPFKSYLELLEPHFQDYPQDVTEENMQARIRGMILMAISNKMGYIVLSTGNKSELAMGYSTLYGDMCGGLCVLSDVTKQQVYALANWINRDHEIIPFNTIQKPPSAELRINQKDSDSLPDYAIVDNVIKAYLEDHLPPEDIAKSFGYSLELVKGLVARIHRNEYKRRQSPPGLRISSKAFSIGRRFPIVQRYIL